MTSLSGGGNRLTGCKYACIGCRWRGPAHEAAEHETQCSHPAKSAADLLTLLAERERENRQATAVYEQILDLLSYEKITFNGESSSLACLEVVRLVSVTSDHNTVLSMLSSVLR